MQLVLIKQTSLLLFLLNKPTQLRKKRSLKLSCVKRLLPTNGGGNFHSLLEQNVFREPLFDLGLH